jgi:intracellular multiplication protein IcmK
VPQDVASELTELKKRVDDVLRAAGTPVDSSAKPQANHVKLTQKPDEDPPVVRVASGLPTSLIFTDVTGAPWPIEYAVPGSAGQFDIMLPSAGTPTLQLRPRTPHAYGGINVKLVDNPIPVSVIVAAAQKTVDVRLDVVILKRGPNAIAPMIQGAGSSDTQADSVLTSFLYGIPPSGAKQLTSTSKRVDAWYYNNLMYVRSSIPLVSPNPIKSSRSVDGTYAYMFTQVPIVNVTEDGVISSVTFVE